MSPGGSIIIAEVVLVLMKIIIVVCLADRVGDLFILMGRGMISIIGKNSSKGC
jgi:hypothetical protein